MRVAFDAIALLSPLTGIGQYAHELATRLATDPSHQARFFYAVLWRDEVRTGPLPASRNLFPWLRRLPNSYAISRYLQGRKFAQEVRDAKFDVYHAPNFLSFPFPGPTVTTVHDLSWIRFPQSHPIERVRAMHRYFEPGLRRSSLILTDSQFVKQEVMDVFGIAPERIVPVPLGVTPLFHPRSPEETAPVLRPLGLAHGQYLLTVGTLEPRKNLVAALRAYAQLPEHTQRAFPLVLAGMKGWHSGELDREMAPLLASGRVRMTGYLAREDLAALIAGATALVYPSIYEGFGLPPLEAMASGVPTIVSNVSSLPEVVGDTGLLVEPHDHAGLRDAMQHLLDAPEVRAGLAARALARAAGFSWDQCAAETFAAYERAARD
ncbi:MAG: glycosyltransferase family 1 protein [Ramlibacter sp.]|nr:glycosyltransferase family 1 protein [Ramlibacter sp.]